MSIAERVRQSREAKGWSQSRLAEEVRRLGGKLSQQNVGNIEGGTVDRPKALPEIAAALGVAEEWLRTGQEQAPATNARFAEGQTAFLPARQDMPKDVPVFGTSMGGDGTGDFEFNGQIVDYVRRPPRLDGRTDVFAIYVQGASMSPWREPGELAYVERNRPPRTGDYVVVEFQADAHNVRPALIKKLAALTPTKIKLQQYNPPRVIELDRMKKRHQLYRVIDWTELMGV